jgi:hypothetical protein
MASKKSTTPQTLMSKPKQDDSFESFVNVDKSIEQKFTMDVTGQNNFRATLQGEVELHYFNASKGIDENETLCLSLDIYEDEEIDWDNAENLDECPEFLETKPSNASFAPLNPDISNDKNLKRAKKSLVDWAYRTKRLKTFKSTSPRLSSQPYESLGDFKVRIKDILDDKKEQEIEKLQKRYEKKEKTLMKRLQRAQDKVEKEEADASKSMVDTGIAILGALFGRSSTAKIGRAFSRGSRAYKERGDIGRAEEALAELHEEIELLAEELEDKIDELSLKYDVENINIQESALKPRKSDIYIDELSLVWVV